MHTHWNAPPPSRERQTWSSPTETVVLESVVATPWLRSMLPVVRGSAANPPLRPVPDRATAWGTVRRMAWTYANSMRAGASDHFIWSLCRANEAEERPTGEALLDPNPPTLDGDLHRQLASKVFYGGWKTFGRHRGPREDALIQDAMTDYLVSSLGLEEAVSIILRVTYKHTGLDRLRALIADLDDAAYLAMANHVRTARDEALAACDSDSTKKGIRQAASYILPVGSVADDIATALWVAAYKPIGRFGSGLNPHISASCDLERFDEVFEANKDASHAPSSWSRGRKNPLATMVVAHGRDFVDRMLRTNGRYLSWWTLLAHIDDPRVFDHLEAADDTQEGVVAARGIAATLHAGFRARGFEPGPLPEPADFDEPEPTDPVPYTPPAGTRGMPRPEGAPEPRLALEESEVDAIGEGLSPVHPHIDDSTWLEHHERWGVPIPLPLLRSQPEPVVARLLSLGFRTWVSGPRLWQLIQLVGDRVTDHFVTPPATEDGDDLKRILPIGDVRIYPLIARLFTGKKYRALALQWIRRHPEHACWAALRATDDIAERVLKYLVARGHEELVHSMAHEAGVDDIRERLQRDPLTPKIRKKTKLPTWVRGLPPLEGPEGAAAPDAVREELLRFATSDEHEPHPALLTSPWTAASRSAFVWALFEAWLGAGAPAKQQWCLQALGYWGDDAIAHRLAAMARKWPGEKAAKRAQWSLATLGNIGSLAALVEIHRLAESSRFPAFKDAARAQIRSIARRRGLSADELADRLAPTMDLEEHGAHLDYGTRQFRIRFDETGLPLLHDEDDKRLKSPPKKRADEDAAQVKAETSWFKTLKKTAKSAAALHVRRLETLMVDQRFLDAASFREHFQQHPWMTHLCQRLVWRDESGHTFRIDESGELVDVHDEPWVLGTDVRVTMAHPLDTDLAPWITILSDYEIVQPFPQLTRTVVQPEDQELATGRCTRFEGARVATAALLGLRGKGWRPEWGSHVRELEGSVGRTAVARLRFEPGWYPGDPIGDHEHQTLESMVVSGSFHPVQFAEMLATIEELVREG